MEFQNEKHFLAVKTAFLRVNADPAWGVFRKLAEEVIKDLERKSIDEEDEAKAALYRHDARGARKFWLGWVKQMELIMSADVVQPGDAFLDVATD